MGRANICGMCKKRPYAKSKRRCNICHAKAMRKWRKTHPPTPEQKLKSNCRAYAKVYLKRGKIKKKPCKKCGDPRSQMHHPNYKKPLLVIWLCRPCHLQLHKEKALRLSARRANVSRIPFL